MEKGKNYGPNLIGPGGDLSMMALFFLCDARDEGFEVDPEVFDEATLAIALRSVAEDSDPYILRMALREVANALDHPDAPHRLKIARPKAGRPITFAKRDRAVSRDMGIAWTVWASFKETSRMKPAVFDACRKHKVSYATVYKAIKAEARMERLTRRIGFPDPNPDPDPDNASSAEWRAVYREYRDWLYGLPSDDGEKSD